MLSLEALGDYLRARLWLRGWCHGIDAQVVWQACNQGLVLLVDDGNGFGCFGFRFLRLICASMGFLREWVCNNIK